MKLSKPSLAIKKLHTITFTQVIVFFSTICYFELFSLSRWEADGIAYPAPTLLLGLFAAGRLLISSVEILRFIVNNGKRYMPLTYGLILFVFSLLLSPFLNQHMIQSALISSWTYIGFVLFCDRLSRQYQKQFWDSMLVFFGLVSVLDLIGIIIFPFEPIHGYSFLGGKNSAFDYNLIFLFLLYQNQYPNLQKVNLYTLVFILGGLLRDSMNTVICLSVLLVGYFLCILAGMFSKKFISRVIIPVLIAFEGIILSISVFAKNSSVLNALGNYNVKFFSFSGRTYLWEEAIWSFLKYPFGGGMIGDSYKIPTANGFLEYTHPHNKFLGILAGEGIIPIMLLLLLLLCITWSRSHKTAHRANIMSDFFLFSYLLHMLFDDTSYFRFFLVIILYVYTKKSSFIRTENVEIQKNFSMRCG